MEKNLYEGWNKNLSLWNNITFVLQNLYSNFSLPFDKKEVNNLSISNKCYEDKEKKEFFNIAEIPLSIAIEYPENKETDNKKKWKKIKRDVEECFQRFFPEFELPEKSHKAVLNPLLSSGAQATLEIEDMESKILSFDEICDVLDISTKDTLFTDRISFILSIKRNETSLDNFVRTGINEINDNIARIVVNCKILISSPIDYCKYVINSSNLSEILYTNYLEKQLMAFQGLTEWPTERINLFNVEKYFFNTNKEIPSYIAQYPSGQILNIPKKNLEYENYILETKKLYKENEKEIRGELADLPSIRNKCIAYLPEVQTLVYTDSFGVIKQLSLFGSEFLSQERINILCDTNIQNEDIQEFFRMIRAFSIRLNKNSIAAYNIDDLLDSKLLLKDVTEDKYPQFFECLNACYNHWDLFDFDFITKLKNKIFAEILLKKISYRKIEKPESYSNNRISSLPRLSELPLNLISMLDGTKEQKNQFIDFPQYYRDDFFFAKINLLTINKGVKRAAIVSSDVKELYNRLAIVSEGEYNGFIINNETITFLYKTMGNKLTEFFSTLPSNTIFFIHPEVFFNSSILGDTELCLADKISFRNLMVELLETLNLEFIALFKYEKIDFQNRLVISLRRLFSSAKYRVVYGNIDCSDIALLDPNAVLDGRLNESDLKTFAINGKLDVSSFANINKIKDSLIDQALPVIREHFICMKLSDNQQQYYSELLDHSYNTMLNNEDYMKMVLQSELGNSFLIQEYLSNYLSYSNIFANVPSSELFIYKEKFQDLLNPNLTSNKLDYVYQLVYSHMFGGIVNYEKVNAKPGNILIVSANNEVQDYFYQQICDKMGPNFNHCYILKTEEDIDSYNRERNIGFITEDLFYCMNITNTTTYIFLQPSWYNENICTRRETIQRFSTKSIYSNEVDIYDLIFDKTLEINCCIEAIRYYIEKEDEKLDGIKGFSKIQEQGRILPQTLLYVDELKIYSEEDLNKLVELFNKYNDFKDMENNLTKANLMKSIKIGTRLSDEKMKSLMFQELEHNELGIGTKAFVPFINNLFIPNLNVLPYIIDEKYSDINGNSLYYKSRDEEIKVNDLVYTAFGVATIKEFVREGFIISVPNFGEIVIPKTLIYVGIGTKFEKYAESVRNYGTCQLDKYFINPTTLQPKDEDIRLDVADNSIDLSIAYINGLPSIYTRSLDKDNIRLEDYGFDIFKELFLIKIGNESEFERFIEKVSKMKANLPRLNILKQVYEHYSRKENFFLSRKYNYFQLDQVKSEEFELYPLIQDNVFYVIFNGNFYQRQAYKLSRDFNTFLIRTFYIKQSSSIENCKYELIKVSKTLNIVNFNHLLKFFEEPHKKLSPLKLAEIPVQTQEKELSLDLEKIKEREMKLKKRIQQVREQKGDNQ